jgi:hypothetical protein
VTAITFWSRRVVKLQSPLCEFGNGPVLNPVTGARSDYDIAKGSAPDPPSLCVDIWDDTGNNIVEHVAGVEDYQVALATFRAACERWPGTPITLHLKPRSLSLARREPSAERQNCSAPPHVRRAASMCYPGLAGGTLRAG